jgi:tagatose-1,6-bisphosphate aldolase non-catalytic subunit AgaZ/GatZ
MLRSHALAIRFNHEATSMSEYLIQLAKENSHGVRRGTYSVCSAHPWVLEAAMRHALHQERPLLIEATCNQVNQFGGYTGMTPRDFHAYVEAIADSVGFPRRRLILGGDHLGPHPWTHLAADEAMQQAIELVHLYENSFGHQHGLCRRRVSSTG